MLCYPYFSPSVMDELLSIYQLPSDETFCHFADTRLDRYILYYRLLDTYEEDICQRMGTDLTALLISKYYWQGKAEYRHQLLYGNDAGFAQQTFRVLEELTQRLDDLDWDVIQAVQDTFDQDLQHR